MTTYRSTLTRKGQATIPVEIREKMGIKEGDALIWQENDGNITVIGAREYVQRMRGMLKAFIDPAKPPLTIEEMKEAAAEGWTERERRWQFER
jgi:AbrB family looped-hinge helix DNA binding protein